MSEELKLRGYAGQYCDVTLVKRGDGTRYVRFDSRHGFGNPNLEEADLIALVDRLAKL